MKYQYIGNGDFFQGLPAIDLDDTDLTDSQIALLIIAAERGLYRTVGDLIQNGQTAVAQSLILADAEVRYGKSGSKATADKSEKDKRDNEDTTKEN